MAQWKIDKYVLEANLIDDKLDLSHIKDDLEDFVDRETNMYKIKKMLNLSTVLFVYIDRETCKVSKIGISITSLFDSNNYRFSIEDFKKIIKEIDDEDAENTVSCLKNYFTGLDELSFLNMVDELGIERE